MRLSVWLTGKRVFGEEISALPGSGERPVYETAAIGGPKQKVNAYAAKLANYGNKVTKTAS